MQCGNKLSRRFFLLRRALPQQCFQNGDEPGPARHAAERGSGQATTPRSSLGSDSTAGVALPTRPAHARQACLLRQPAAFLARDKKSSSTRIARQTSLPRRFRSFWRTAPPKDCLWIPNVPSASWCAQRPRRCFTGAGSWNGLHTTALSRRTPPAVRRTVDRQGLQRALLDRRPTGSRQRAARTGK